MTGGTVKSGTCPICSTGQQNVGIVLQVKKVKAITFISISQFTKVELEKPGNEKNSQRNDKDNRS
jgi:hypothetical protein